MPAPFFQSPRICRARIVPTPFSELCTRGPDPSPFDIGFFDLVIEKHILSKRDTWIDEALADLAESLPGCRGADAADAST